MQLGTNLGGFSDWSVERPLKNLLKHVRSEILTYEDNCFAGIQTYWMKFLWTLRASQAMPSTYVCRNYQIEIRYFSRRW